MILKVFKKDCVSSIYKNFAIPVLEGNKGYQALKELLVGYQANLRQGNAKTKSRSEVRGSGRKIHNQKGTGRARHGDKQCPIYVGGGTAHGPKLKDWRKNFNKKVRILAHKRALLDKVVDGKLFIIESIEIPILKTKILYNLVRKIIPTGKVLIVDNNLTTLLKLTASNIKSIYLREAINLNALDIVRYPNILISEIGLNLFLTRITRLDL